MFLFGVVRPFDTRSHRAEQTLVVCTEKGQDRNRVRDSESRRGREREGERGRDRVNNQREMSRRYRKRM